MCVAYVHVVWCVYVCGICSVCMVCGVCVVCVYGVYSCGLCMWCICVWCMSVWCVASVCVSGVLREVRGSVSGRGCLQASTEAWAHSAHSPEFQATKSPGQTRTDQEALPFFFKSLAVLCQPGREAWIYMPCPQLTSHLEDASHRHLGHGGCCAHLDCSSQPLMGGFGSSASRWQGSALS